MVLPVVKSQDRLKNIPIIMFSSLSQTSDIQIAKDLGASDYLDKSNTDINVLKTKIDTLLG